ncbi:MAG: hypothetical protein JXR63_04180 [Spirochaetales bacterium]|nr:hypothetical protein [Spirochaetales bacterium]
MEKNYIVLLILLFFSLSCSRMSDTFWISEANYDYQKGNYHLSTYKYLKVLEKNENEIVQYNLGNVYYLLGEKGSAIEEWDKISQGVDGELKFRIEFNRGVLYFDQASYSLAFDSFKNALILKPSSIEAKRNLELTILKIDTLKNTGEGVSSSSSNRNSDSRRHSNLLNYVKRQEIRQWGYSQEKERSQDIQNDW